MDADGDRCAGMSKPPGERMYHINLAKGECAKHVVLVGDPARTDLARTLLEKVTLSRAHREFVSLRGSYRGLDVTVLSTGIGPDNAEIVMVELLQVVRRPIVIRAGSCGSLQEQVEAGDLIITSGAVRLENTTEAYAPPGYPAVADLSVVLALKEACRRLGYRHHVGITATAPGFYAPQGRVVGRLRPQDPHLLRELRRMGVLNFEMETSTILILSQLAGAKAGSVCAVFADRVRDRFLSPEERREAELRCLRAALEAHLLLATGEADRLLGLKDG
jgi:uridine phosphorylase